MNFNKYHVSRNLWDNRGFSATAITSNHAHNTSNVYGTAISTTEGNEVTIIQSAYPTGNVGYQNGFFFIDVDFSKYAVGDIITISFDYIVNEIHALSTQTSTTIYAGKNNNTITPTLSSGDWKISGRLTVVVTIIEDMNPYIEVRLCGNSITVKNIMLNTGSSPLPYEPYSSEVWHDTPHYIHKTSTDTITTLPADIYPNDTTATVGLKGQTVQSTTPTPQNPIQPSECGERTGNLWSIAPNANVGYNQNVDSDISETPGLLHVSASDNGMILTADSSWAGTAWKIKASVGMTYYISFTPMSLNLRATIYTADGNNKVKRRIANYSTNFPDNKELTILSDEQYIVINISVNTIATVEVTKPMITTNIIPYEPYGIKIPISSANTTTPVYLGEVQTTRKIKKLVLTGEENWDQISGNAPYRLLLPTMMSIANRDAIFFMCSHFLAVSNNTSWSQYDSCVSVSFSGGISVKGLQFRYTAVSSLDSFKSYLAAQYAAGTPVTVWYVLATEETAVVNEPLMCIGDYADTLSNISIPTTAGGDTLSVDTTVQPSEVTVNYTGWHTGVVHERDSGQWD